LLEIVEEFYVAPCAEERGDGFALAVADLEGEQAVGLEEREGLGDNAAIEVEAFGAGVEGKRGLVVADLRVEGWRVFERNVGWIGEDGVEWGFVGDGG
jgi:hypothetical protein